MFVKPVSPVSLCDHRVKVIIRPGNPDGGPAYVAGLGSHYEIHVADNIVAEMARRINAPESMITLGLLYHEVAHLRFESFQGQDGLSQLGRWVDNLIEDTRIEYHMSFDYPYVAKYIALALLALKDKLLTDPSVEEDIVEKASGWLLHMVRLNTIPADCDPDFAEFALPRILLARRSNRPKAIRIGEEITNYIEMMAGGTSNGLQEKEIEDVSEGTSEGENEESENEESESEESENEESEESEGKSGNAESEEEEQEAEETEEESGGKEQTVKERRIEELLKQLDAGGLNGGKGEQEIVDDVVDSSDYIRSVLAKNSDAVGKVHKAFSEIFTKNSHRATKEGDLNIKRQQEAYLNGMTNEEEYDYEVLRKNLSAFDCVILRDVSGSTEHQKNQYAESVCILIKALEELKNVNVALIDFESSVVVQKTFEQELRKTKIIPEAKGGTNMLEAIQKLDELDYKHKMKLVIVLTDGHPNGSDAVAMKVAELGKTYEWMPIYFGNSGMGFGFNPHYGMGWMRQVFGPTEHLADVADLHKLVYKLIAEKVLK